MRLVTTGPLNANRTVTLQRSTSANLFFFSYILYEYFMFHISKTLCKLLSLTKWWIEIKFQRQKQKKIHSVRLKVKLCLECNEWYSEHKKKFEYSEKSKNHQEDATSGIRWRKKVLLKIPTILLFAALRFEVIISFSLLLVFSRLTSIYFLNLNTYCFRHFRGGITCTGLSCVAFFCRSLPLA